MVNGQHALSKKRASEEPQAFQHRCEELVPMRKEKWIEKIWCPQQEPSHKRAPQETIYTFKIDLLVEAA